MALLFFVCVNNSFAQAPDIDWQKCYGGISGEEGRSIKRTPDGGYILAGHMGYYPVPNSSPSSDFMVLKMDASGNKQWQKFYGGSESDGADEIILTSDGGYIMIGRSFSNDGNVSGHHGSKYTLDMWVVKIDAVGNLQWERSIGGTRTDYGRSIRQTSDGGYIVIGTTNSEDGDITSGIHGQVMHTDYLVVKLSPTGQIQWQKCYGGTGPEVGMWIEQTSDGGYIALGAAASTNGDINPADHEGVSEDYWLVKLTASGTIQWERSYGGYNSDWPEAGLFITPDGGYLMGGRSAAYDGDVIPNPLTNNNAYDYWVLKVNATGNIVWQKSMGGNNIESCWGMEITADGGCIVSGASFSNDGDVVVPPALGSSNGWVVKLSATGQIQWKKTIGSKEWDTVWGITTTEDGGYIMTGYAGGNSGDISGFQGGYGDVWIVKLKPTPCVPSIDITASADDVCSGTPITFTATTQYPGNAPTYNWLVNGLSAGSGGTFTSSGLSNNDSIICMMTSNASCASPQTVRSDTIVVKVRMPVQPTVSITADDETICPGTRVTFTATGSNAGNNPSYVWKVNGVVQTGNTNIFYSTSLVNGDVVNCTINTSVELTCVTPGAVVSNNIVMTVENAPLATVSIDVSKPEICKGETVRFNAASPDASATSAYQWKVNGINVGSNQPAYNATGLKNGDDVYCVFTPGILGCANTPVSSDIIKITVHDLPLITISPVDTTIAPGSVVQLRTVVTGNIASLQWTPASSLSDPSLLNPITKQLTASTEFKLSVITDEGCTADKTILIKIRRPLRMPNAFTPNGDRWHQYFRIPPDVQFTLREFSIYDRWGNKVFTTTDISKGWDGTFHGKPLGSGTFAYVITGSDDTGKVMLKGTVVLIR